MKREESEVSCNPLSCTDSRASPHNKARLVMLIVASISEEPRAGVKAGVCLCKVDLNLHYTLCQFIELQCV